jgi:hypothetical protein
MSAGQHPDEVLSVQTLPSLPTVSQSGRKGHCSSFVKHIVLSSACHNLSKRKCTWRGQENKSNSMLLQNKLELASAHIISFLAIFLQSKQSVDF